VQGPAWQWALANRASDGTLPTGSQIARQHGRHERWGRLVRSAGMAGGLTASNKSGLLEYRTRTEQVEMEPAAWMTPRCRVN